jgi:hypothetical protein
MKGDYSRETFDRTKNFARVLLQQGRVLLDSDFNEQASILLHYLQTLAADLIGPYGGPADNVGFGIEIVMLQGSDDIDDLRIGAGRYYVDGILCENLSVATEASSAGMVSVPSAHLHPPATRSGGGGSVTARRSMYKGLNTSEQQMNYGTFLTQPDYPFDQTDFEFPEDPFLVYLDVFERHISALEDPSILEGALGGPDTAARAKIVWQVKLLEIPQDLLVNTNPKDITCETFNADSLEKLRELLEPGAGAMLKAKTKEPEDINATDPCTVSPDARYRGAENQLYRVEIHRGGEAGDKGNGATFKFSRDNGSKIYPIVALEDEIVTLGNIGRDDLSSLDVGDWVEIVTDDFSLLSEARPLFQVVAIPDPLTMQLTLSDNPGLIFNENSHTLLRRWDHQESTDPTAPGGLQLGSDGAALIVEGNGNTAWLELEDGIQIQFQPGATYRTGDYWLIPARTGTGDIEWPNTNGSPQALPPRGVMHHYAPLAIIYEDAEEFKLNDLRRTWGYLAQCATCPIVKVDGPDTVDANVPVDYEAKLINLPQGSTPSYNWSVSAGSVAAGQGTSQVTVDTQGQAGKTIIVTVNVGGLPPGCDGEAHHQTKINPPPPPPVNPTVTVNAPATGSDENQFIVTSTPHDFPANSTLEFQWTVTPALSSDRLGAEVIGGTNKQNVTIVTHRVGGHSVKATVVVKDTAGHSATNFGTTNIQSPTGGVGNTESATPAPTPSASKKRSGSRRSSSSDKDKDEEES